MESVKLSPVPKKTRTPRMWWRREAIKKWVADMPTEVAHIVRSSLSYDESGYIDYCQTKCKLTRWHGSRRWAKARLDRLKTIELEICGRLSRLSAQLPKIRPPNRYNGLTLEEVLDCELDLKEVETIEQYEAQNKQWQRQLELWWPIIYKAYLSNDDKEYERLAQHVSKNLNSNFGASIFDSCLIRDSRDQRQIMEAARGWNFKQVSVRLRKMDTSPREATFDMLHQEGYLPLNMHSDNCLRYWLSHYPNTFE